MSDFADVDSAPPPLTDAELRLLAANEHYTGGKDHLKHKLVAHAEAPSAVDVAFTAEELKEKGNARYAKGDDASASAFYTQALKLTDDRTLRRILLSNRSAARLRGGDPEGALIDAEDCMILAPGWSKAVTRKGLALMALRRFQEALDCFNRGLESDHSNEALVSGAKRALDGVNCTGEFAPPPQQDPLEALFSSVAEIEKTTSVTKRHTAVDHDAETAGWTRENQVERILQKHHKYLNLNPFHVFGIATTANDEDVKKRFHKLSSLVHPDKNPDPRAREAFEIVKNAQGELNNPDRKSLLLMTFHECRMRVEARRKQERKALKMSSRAFEEKKTAEGKTLDVEVDIEIKKTLATNEEDRLHAERLRQRNEEFLAARVKQDAAPVDWQKVKEEEDEFKQGSDERLRQWAEFTKKQRKM